MRWCFFRSESSFTCFGVMRLPFGENRIAIGFSEKHRNPRPATTGNIDMADQDNQPNEFESAGDEQPSILVEVFYFMRDNKKWWMLPIVIVLAFLGILIALAATGLAPFVYTLF